MWAHVKSASPPRPILKPVNGTCGRAEAIRSMPASLLRFRKGKGCAMSLAADLGRSRQFEQSKAAGKAFFSQIAQIKTKTKTLLKHATRSNGVEQPLRRKRLRWLRFVRLFDPVPFTSWHRNSDRPTREVWALHGYCSSFSATAGFLLPPFGKQHLQHNLYKSDW